MTGRPPAATAAADGDLITVGFTQVGAESGWRAANTKSIQDALTEDAGFDLKFSDAQQKQENQIQAIRSYIAAGRRRHRVLPGRRDRLGRGARGGQGRRHPGRSSPTARSTPRTTSLYVTFIGSDFVEEGERAGDWVSENLGTEPINVVELAGHDGLRAGHRPQDQGFEDAIAGNDNIEVIASQTGDFTRAEGKQVMEGFLQAYPDIDVVFAHNDDMGLGAIEAIEAAGKVPGQDIKIVTIDARQGRHAGPGRRQDQLHRRVQPAARAGPRRDHQDGRRPARRYRRAAHRHRGPGVRPGAAPRRSWPTGSTDADRP